ncbi:hypothetical protein QWY31_06470 [Cytophagales bacterium LB-30]|uniref:Uncharacterized protein n=1 Tax=Shiella aurantiaca TaxID=3058365 RepID=A0ABT8F3Y1_9BACT|nr:hypothetical protein [Shiella aurantiaca]MDN4165137.1 hypothetical protein [Shiella aurantiaca]
MNQPSLYFLGIRIDEPVTTLTDLLISLVCFYAYFRLTRGSQSSKIGTYFRYFFMSMGLATALGGLVGHGFLYAFPFPSGWEVSPWKLPGWLVSMLSITLIERASIEYAKPLISQRTAQVFKWINLIEFFLFVGITFSTLDFFYVEVHSAYGLLVVVASFHFYIWIKTRSKASLWILAGVGFSAMAAAVFMQKLALSIWFNHFDISHVAMSISAWCFFKGALVCLIDHQTPLSRSQNT